MKRPRLVVWLHRRTSARAWCECFHANERTIRAWPVHGSDGVYVSCTACDYNELAWTPETRS